MFLYVLCTSGTQIKLEQQQKQGGEGAAELLPKESHATASLISRRC